MLKMPAIQAAAQRVAVAAKSQSKVILFGSYARGTVNDDSDLDLPVVEREVPDKTAEYLRLRSAVFGSQRGSGAS